MATMPEPQQSEGKRSGGRLGRLVPPVLVVVAAAVVVLIAMMPHETVPPPLTEISPTNVKVRLIRTVPELADTFDLTAIVEPDRIVSVAAEVSGRIEGYGDRSRGDAIVGVAPRNEEDPRGLNSAVRRTALQEGDRVAVGDPIVRLNRDLLRTAFKRAQAQFDYDQREYLRILDLFEREASSKTELDDARTRRDVTEALLDEALAQLERTTIVAPIGGILNRLPMEIGEYAAPGDCVAEIVDTVRAKVVVDTPERDVHYLSVGDTASVFTYAPHEVRLTGDITYISELADARTRTTRLEITVDNSDGRLRSGQIVRARLKRRVLNDVIMIPLSAVIPLENEKAVYIADTDDRAQRRLVELGFIKGRSVRVVGGLEPGDRLIVSGHRYVGPGQPVTIVTEQ